VNEGGNLRINNSIPAMDSL